MSMPDACERPFLQAQAAQQYEQEFEAFQSGKYKESAQNWLQSSWQGDALQVCFPHSCIHHIIYHILLPLESSDPEHV